MDQKMLVLGATLALIGAAAVIGSTSFATCDRGVADEAVDNDDIADPAPRMMGVDKFPPGADGILTDDTGQTYFSTPNGDRMNAAGEIVMPAAEAAERELERARRQTGCDDD